MSTNGYLNEIAALGNSAELARSVETPGRNFKMAQGNTSHRRQSKIRNKSNHKLCYENQ